MITIGRMVTGAWLAMSTRRKSHDYMVTGLKIGNTGSHPLHYPCSFMAQDHWQRNFSITLTDFDIGMTDAGGNNPDENLLGLRIINVERFKSEWGRSFSENLRFYRNCH
jgi:hypothetical protein